MKTKHILPLLASSTLSSFALHAANKPNIVFLMIDDLGWGEFSSYGNTFNETPNIKALGQEGMTFTHAYSAGPVSSPTRACLHTGQYTPRHGICDFLPESTANYLDPDKHVTINEALKNAGYYTGLIGKWHLDTEFAENKGGPTAHGYDWVFGTETKYIAGGDYFYPYDKISTITTGIPNEFLTDRLCREAENFMTAHKDNPFFLSIQLYSVHMTLEAPQDLVDKYKLKYEQKYGAGTSSYFDTSSPRHAGAPDNPYMAAMLEKIDNNVGSIIQKIKDLGLDDNTIFILYSDNGGDQGVANNGGLRGYKTWLYEGGIRVPLIIRYPNKCTAGAVCETPVSTIDFYPTFLELAGNATTTQLLDGVSIAPLFQNGTINRDELYWYYPAGNSGWNNRKGCVIRKGDYKLIYRFGLAPDNYELYNLKADPSENTNIIATETAKANELKTKLDSWMEEMYLPKWSENSENNIYNFETQFIGNYGTKGNLTTPPAATTDKEDVNHEYFDRVANPFPTGINTTATVGKFKRSKMGYWWAFSWFDFPTTYIAASETKPMYLHIMVHKPIKSKVCIQLKGINNAVTKEIQISNKTTNQWEDLVFEINTPNFFSTLEFKADFVNTDNPPYPNRLSEDIDIYVDEIIVNNDQTPRGGCLTENQEQKITDFETGFVGKRGTNGNGNGLTEDHEAFGIVDNPFKNEKNNSDKVAVLNRKINGNWWAYAWFNFDTISIETSPKYLHVMVNKPIVSTICAQMKDQHASPSANTGEIKSEAQTLVNDWQDIVFKINNTGDYCYFEFKPDFINAVPSTRLTGDINIYFDDLIINDSPDPRQKISTGRQAQTSDSHLLQIFPIYTSGQVSINNKEANPVLMEIYTTTGQMMLSKIISSGVSTLNFNFLMKGIYLFKFITQTKSTLKKIQII